jgi:predicted XRE-type DNA-binding protein
VGKRLFDEIANVVADYLDAVEAVNVATDFAVACGYAAGGLYVPGLPRHISPMVRKTGTASRDLDRLRAEVGAAIQALMGAQGLTTLAASKRTGINRTEFSRVRNGRLDGFALDRLVYMAFALGIRCSLHLAPPKGRE